MNWSTWAPLKNVFKPRVAGDGFLTRVCGELTCNLASRATIQIEWGTDVCVDPKHVV